MLQLRDYQLEAIERVRVAFTSGSQGVFLVLPTGGGKTVIFTEVIRQALKDGQRCAVMAHRGELIKQAGNTINKNGMWHGVIKAGPSTFPLAPIQVASIDSMRARTLPWEPDLIVLDEAHLSKAKRYKDFLAKYPKAKRLLVSATPIRGDGSGFDDIADELIIGATIQQLIAHPDGPFLVRPRIYTGSDLGNRLDKVKTTGGDYNQHQLEGVMTETKLVGDIVTEYNRLASGRKGVVFCVGIAHSKMVAEQFNAAGIIAEHLDGTMPDGQRDAILERLNTGETTIVTNAQVLCEGWDEPSISYVALARPTKSLALYIQQAGRGIRICPEAGKTDCIIIDHGQNIETHGHILEERDWSLQGKGKPPKKKKVSPWKICGGCGEWISRKSTTCPHCGYQPVQVITTVATELNEAVQNKEYTEIQKTYRGLLRMAKENGRKAGWAYFRVIERFGQEAVKQDISWGMSQRFQAELYHQ